MLVLGQHKAVIMEQVPGFDMPDHAGASTESTFMTRPALDFCGLVCVSVAV